MFCENRTSCLSPKQYINEEQRICQPCHSSCFECYGPNFDQCLSCQEKQYLLPPDNLFIDEILRRYFLLYFTKADLISFPGIVKSRGLKMFCTNCKIPGRGINPDYQLCQICKQDCLKCKDAYDCKECLEDYFLLGGNSCSNRSLLEVNVSYFKSYPATFLISFDDEWPDYISFITNPSSEKIGNISFSPPVPQKNFKYSFISIQQKSAFILNISFSANISKGTVLQIFLRNLPSVDSYFGLINKNLSFPLLGYKNCPLFGYAFNLSKIHYYFSKISF